MKNRLMQPVLSFGDGVMQRRLASNKTREAARMRGMLAYL